MAPELDLDQEVIRCLDSVQELLVLQHSLSLHLREGWMDMARARYSMGPSRVSQPLFSLKPYSASARVSLVPPDDNAGLPLHMSLLRLDSGKNTSATPSESHTPREGQASQHDHSRSAAVPSDWSRDEDAAYRRIMAGVTDSDSDSEAAGGNEATEQTRPLRWFGAFVSPQLQAAQSSFELALEILVKISNAQGQATHAYNEVMQQRDDMKLDAPAKPEAQTDI